jgi:hypothetical protein
MVGYYQTLCDPEKFPPVRLGGETMVPTALTTLHTVIPFTAANTNPLSIVVIPRVWNPCMSSNTVSAPYSYSTASGFVPSSVTTLQSIAAAARVVSCKVKVYSTSSATNDNGALTCGLAPLDPGFFAGNNGLTSLTNTPNTSLATLATNLNQVSVSGYPVTSVNGTTSDTVTNATQGANEFPGEDWTDTMPLKTGSATFWLPEDPSSMIFSSDRLRQSLVQQISTTGTGAGFALNSSPMRDPFFCIGVTGLVSGSTFNVEITLNLEYTVTAGASNVVETRPGCMSSVEQFSIAKRVGGNLNSYVEPNPEASLLDKLKGVGSAVLRGGVSRVSDFIFGSSDVGKAINSLF